MRRFSILLLTLFSDVAVSTVVLCPDGKRYTKTAFVTAAALCPPWLAKRGIVQEHGLCRPPCFENWCKNRTLFDVTTKERDEVANKLGYFSEGDRYIIQDEMLWESLKMIGAPVDCPRFQEILPM